MNIGSEWILYGICSGIRSQPYLSRQNGVHQRAKNLGHSTRKEKEKEKEMN